MSNTCNCHAHQLAQRLRDAADAIEELNRQAGFADPNRAAVSPQHLRREADALEEPDVETSQ